MKNKINSQQRHRARSFAMQALYQWQLTGEEINVILLQFLQEMNAKKTDTFYFRELVSQVTAIASQLDQLFQPLLDRNLKDLGPIELAILRLAVYELQHNIAIPYKVVINEAIILAKNFAATDAHKYINGVLDQLAPALRSIEYAKPVLANNLPAIKLLDNAQRNKKITMKPASSKPKKTNTSHKPRSLA
jgi:transcription antitermination protein NusB